MLAAAIVGTLASLAAGDVCAATFQNLRDPEYITKGFLEAKSETSGPWLSMDDPDASTTQMFRAPEAGLASGAAASAGWHAGGPGQAMEFRAEEGLARPCFLNLSAPISGDVYWSNSYVNALTVDPTGQAADNGHLENGRFRVEVFQGEARIGGEDTPVYAATDHLNVAETGWLKMRFSFRSEVHVLKPGEPLRLKITRMTDSFDLWIGTQGGHQSFVEFRCFEKDPLDGLLYLERGTLTLLDIDPSRPAEPASSPAAILLAGSFLLLAPGRGRKKAALVAAVVVAASLGGCFGTRGAHPAPADEETLPSADVERGFELNETLERTGFGAITGTVRDGNRAGMPLPDVAVIVVGTNRFGKTAPTGRYLFTDMPPGSYVVHFDRSGYVAVEDRIEVAAGVTSYLNFTMYTIASGGSRGFSGAAPHPHDLWGGALRKEFYDDSFTPTYIEEEHKPLAAAGRICTESEIVFTCPIYVPIDLGKAVIPGTTMVEVTADWSTANPRAPREMTLEVSTPVAAYHYVARPPGQMFRVAVFPNEADVGHQNFTNWGFTLRPVVSNPHNPAKVAYVLPSVHVRIELVRGPIPLEPSHLDYWGAETELPLLHDARKPRLSQTQDYPVADASDPNGLHRWTIGDGNFVPVGTLELRGRLNWSAPFIGFNPNWGLLYKPANLPNTGWTFDELGRAEFRGATATGADFVIRPTSDELDKFYQPASYWRFYIDDNRAPLVPLVSFQPNDAPAPVKGSEIEFALTLTAIKDPSYRAD